MSEEYDFLFKSIVVGDGGVGKTALTLRFSKGFFQEKYKMTIGVDFHVKTIDLETEEGTIRTKLQIWDTGGQERFASIRPMYYRGALGALLIFDLTSTPSFEHLPQWIEEIRANAKEEIPLLLVGNKADLEDQREVYLDEINQFSEEFDLYYTETSAKTGKNVGDCFAMLAYLMAGKEIPPKLIKEEQIFAPGQITGTTDREPETKAEEPELELEMEPEIEPEMEPEMAPEYAEQPEPEPSIESEPATASQPEPQQQFTPQSEPELERVSAPQPEPEPKPTMETQSEPEPEPQFEQPTEEIPTEVSQQEAPTSQPSEPQSTDTTISEPSTEEQGDFEFKTPDQILSEDETAKQQAEEISSMSEPPKPSKTSKYTYKPKSVPFSEDAPSPTEPPEDFASQPPEQPESSNQLPPQPPEAPSEPAVQPPKQPETSSQEPPQPPGQSSETLYNYMPDTEETETEQAPEPQQTTAKQQSQSSSLFDTLSKRSKSKEGSKKGPFIPFVSSKEQQSQDTSESNVGFIPDAEETQAPPAAENPGASDKVTCPNCGARLNSDYMFCNKCGEKLN